MGLLNRTVDLTIEPTPEASVASMLPASTLRVYDSSVDGHLSVILGDTTGLRYVDAGTRLNVDQVVELRDALNEWLRVGRP